MTNLNQVLRFQPWNMANDQMEKLKTAWESMDTHGDLTKEASQINLFVRRIRCWAVGELQGGDKEDSNNIQVLPKNRKILQRQLNEQDSCHQYVCPANHQISCQYSELAKGEHVSC